MAIIINVPGRLWHTYLYDRPKAIAPLVIGDQLQKKLYGYQSVNELLAGASFFSFNGPKWKPSIYDIVNNSGQTLQVVMFNRTYNVNDGTIWRFVAHDEIEGRTLDDAYVISDGTPTNQPYWDPLLGGSFWDNYQSPWDGGRL